MYWEPWNPLLVHALAVHVIVIRGALMEPEGVESADTPESE